METHGVIRYLISGTLKRSYILPFESRPQEDIPGGSVFYGAAGLGLWDTRAGLIGQVGEDYPREWLERMAQHDFDTRGVRIIPAILDNREFITYTDLETRSFESPLSHYAHRGLSYPKYLLGYTPPVEMLDSRIVPGPLTTRPNDLPADYLEATSVHLAPTDFLTHSLLPPALRQGQVSTITIDPSSGYMNPAFFDEMPGLLRGISAFITNETKLRALFEGRSSKLWEMAEALGGNGCDIIIIKRGSQGQYVYDHLGHHHWNIPAYPARVVDPTGAGDAFCGGYLAGYRNSYNPLQAAFCGNVSASFCIEGSGPFYMFDTLPGLAQARLAWLSEMVTED
jgi:sugar/nucleoside kinase (ribokinase family)